MMYPAVSAYRSRARYVVAAAAFANSAGQKSISSSPGSQLLQLSGGGDVAGYAMKSFHTAAADVTGHSGAVEAADTPSVLRGRTAWAGLTAGCGAVGGMAMTPSSTAPVNCVRFCCWSAPHAMAKR